MSNIKTYRAFSQIITISQAGRKIISNAESDNQIKATSFSHGVLWTGEGVDSGQIIKPQKKFDFDRQSDLKPIKKVSLPLRGMLYVTSDFGERYHPVLHKKTFHAGIDLRADNEIVNSIANGIILKKGYDSRSGNYLIIQHGNGIESIYCHLSKFLLQPGDLVFAGDGIAVSGATGAVTAPHLHFAIRENGRFLNPVRLLMSIIECNK